jgi:arylsulfatase A-like enzyme
VRRSRRLLWAILPAVVAIAWWLGPTAGPSPPPRNLILISVDTLRADHLGVHGYSRDTSPAIDRFARRSTWFTRAITQGESTLPGHTAMLSSRYYGSYGSRAASSGPPPEVDMLAEILGGHGFATWGFVDGGHMKRVFGFAQGFAHYEDQRVKLRAVLAKVNAWLDTHPAERFFLFVHCYDVHTPYNAPDPYGSSFVDPAYHGTFRPNAANFVAAERREQPFDDTDLRYAIARYDGGVRHVDDQIGLFLERLEVLGLLDSSVVVITSDHGEEFLEHGGFMHTKIFQYPNLHVPLIVHVPGGPPRVVEDVVELVDVVPTVLDLLGLPPHEGTMGRSLATLARGGPDDGFADHVAFAESSLPGIGWRTVVSRRHQLLYDENDGRRQLFDLEHDPAQQTDVAVDDPDTAAALLQILRARLAENARRRQPVNGAPPQIDRDLRRELEALGYVER